MAQLNEGVVDIFMVYQFLKRLATPFDKWDAFKEGVISAKGDILIKKNKRTQKQKKSFQIFDVMILKLKRLLGKIPGGKTRIASYAAALWLIKEDWQNKSEEYAWKLFKFSNVYLYTLFIFLVIDAKYQLKLF